MAELQLAAELEEDSQVLAGTCWKWPAVSLLEYVLQC
jgi:hypothetical protein